MVRLTVRHFLLDAGFRVLEAEDAAQALDLWREHRSDIAILLSDVVLPGLQAHELDRRVKADEPDLPTVWMSAHPRAVLEAQGRIAPSAPLLRKPFGEPELRFAVANALGDRRRRRPGHRPS